MSTKSRTKYLFYIATALGLVACAADPQVAGSVSSSTNLASAQYYAGLVNLDYNDFYTQSDPNSVGCAGDVKNLYDPITGSSLASNGTGTVLPSFIKNISVDITDANSTSSTNKAYGCSYGSGTGTTGASSCATFDYASNGGVNSNYAGSMLLIGGIQSYNYDGVVSGSNPSGLAVACGEVSAAGYNTCSTSVYAFGIDSLPSSAATDPASDLVPGLDSATGSISSFVSLSSATAYAGPQEFVGAAGAYDAGDGLFALFGGSTVIGALGSTGYPAGTNDTTWIFNLAQQTWTQLAVTDLIAAGLIETYEQDGIGTRNLSNEVVGRAVFGYTAVQGLAVNAMSNTTAANSYSLTASHYTSGKIAMDTTDRIAIVGGEISSGGFATDAYKFNPTYGPEWVDTLGRYIDTTDAGVQPQGVIATASVEAVQYLQNYHTEPLFDTTPTGSTGPLSIFEGFSPAAANVGLSIPLVNFGLTAVRDNTNFTGSGYLLSIGGFDTTQTSFYNPQTDGCPTVSGKCAMMIYRRAGRSLGNVGGAGTSETYPSAYSSVGNLPSATISMTSGPTGSGEASLAYTTTQLSPSYWDAYKAAAPSTVPYFGGAVTLPGFNLETNDVVNFGGATCLSYLLGTATNCNFGFNPGVYYSLTSDPIHNNAGGTALPTTVALVGNVPQNAGMAAARGTDPNGNPIIVAWGGMSAAGTAGSSAVHYLYNNGNTSPATPTWGSSTPAGTSPTVLTNAALVFSHVTKKFYLFGGYNSGAGTESADTWELSVTGANCGIGMNSCTFTWRQLDVNGGGIACSPTCPAGRRSHRMVEVNYANANPGGTVGGVTSGESTCSATSPCSYGIFMEGGTSDGVSVISDRWMFDPTANYGNGLWQQMHEMPARTLSAMTSVDYTLANSSIVAHRAVMFGGETGFSDPSWAAAENGSQTFVAPTLGDTWMFDYDTSTWNRVQLLGTGYNGTPVDTGEFQYRQAYDATNPANTDTRSSIAELTPPPTAGHVMVTRTLSGSVASGGTALAIPEVYMIGGRLKDGSYQTLDHVYKFCAGSTGESYANAANTAPWTASTTDITCDAYNATTNSSSTSPQSGYVGRWLRKTPAGVGGITSSQLSSYMGAAAYDNVDDRIVVFGGLQFSGASAPTIAGDSSSFFVTDSASADRSAASTNAGAAIPVYEYTPPTIASPQGSWAVFGACGGTGPTNRYGHSMVYDTLHQQLVVVGGYDENGNPLVNSTVPNVAGTLSIPDTWTAKRDATDGCYTWTQVTNIGNTTSTAPSSTGLSHMIAAYIPAVGYSSGYYSTFDNACNGVGPIADSKYLAGGVYFDIDRTQLGAHENVLLNLTFIPLGPGNDDSNSNALTDTAQAQFRIHLVQTGQTAAQLQSVLQPRFLTYTGNTSYPELIPSIAVVSPPTGQPRTEQVLIPLSANANIDRIRIERYSGTAILISASLFRMGQK